MRGWIGVGALLTLVAAVAIGGSKQALGACTSVLKWRGHLYEGAGVVENPDALRIGPRLRAKAKIPPCIDVLPAPKPRPKPRRVVVRTYQGVPPALGLSQQGSLYFAAGYFPQLPDHPLHAALYGTEAGTPDGTSHGRCTGTRTVGGRVTVSGPYDPIIDPLGRKRMLFLEVDAMTRFVGLSRNGYPYLREGDRIQVSGLRCHDKDLEPEHYLVPRLIARKSQGRR